MASSDLARTGEHRNLPIPKVGLVKAQATDNAVSGILVYSRFGEHEKGTDWNDYAKQHGKAGVRPELRSFAPGFWNESQFAGKTR